MDLERANKVMRERRLDALLAFSPANVFYTTGYRSLVGLLTKTPVVFAVIPIGEDPLLILPSEEEGFLLTQKHHAKRHQFYGIGFGDADVKPHFTSDPFETIAKALTEMGLSKKTVGIDEKVAPIFQIDMLKKNLPRARFVEATSIFDDLRLIKSEEEIQKLRNSLKILEETYISMYESVEEGMSELEFARKFKAMVIEKGADYKHVEVGFGPRSGIGSGTFPSEYRIKRGDVIHFDGGVSYKQYASDICRNAVLKETSQKIIKIHDAVTSTCQEALEMLKPGVMMSEVYKFIKQSVRKKGFPRFDGPYFGHSIGIDSHEPPSIEADSHRPFEPNMVYCVEVPYYSPEIGALSCEDTVLITKDGHEVLSTIDRSLHILK